MATVTLKCCAIIKSAPVHRNAEVAGHPAAIYVGQLKNYVGEPVGVIEVIKNINAAKRALALGYTNVAWYPEGSDGWAAAGLPLEKRTPEPRP